MTLARFLVLGIFPFLTICFLNYKIYLIVNQRRRSGRRQKEDNLSFILMAIVASFLLCNSPRIFLNMHEITVTQEIYECRWGELSDLKASQLTNKNLSGAQTWAGSPCGSSLLGFSPNSSLYWTHQQTLLSTVFAAPTSGFNINSISKITNAHTPVESHIFSAKCQINVLLGRFSPFYTKIRK